MTTPGELFDIIDEAGNNIHDIRICTEDVVKVDVSKAEEEIIPSNKNKHFYCCVHYSLGPPRVVQVFLAAERTSHVF